MGMISELMPKGAIRIRSRDSSIIKTSIGLLKVNTSKDRDGDHIPAEISSDNFVW